MSRRWSFWIAFAAASLLIAGVVSYFASADPDGLDSTTLRGCEVVQTADGEELTGECIAQHTTEHAMADTPLADYAIAGRDGTVGAAGVVGVLVTLALASGAFWVIARRGAGRTEPSGR
ncbi:PDGLE domain-containing protein [Mycolicibacterium sp. XJ1819]